MRLVGASFAARMQRMDDGRFDEVMREAVALLKGEGLTREEAEAQRETLLEGYRWILVDEYQDIGAEEYELIAAVAGRSVEDDDSAPQPVRGRRRRPEHLRLRGRIGRVHPALRSRTIEAQRDAPDRELPVDRQHHPRSQHGDRAGRRADEGGTRHRRRSRRQKRGRWRRLLAEVRSGRAGARADPLRQQRPLFEQAVHAVDELRRLAGLVPDWDWSRVCRDRAGVVPPDAGSQLLRGARHSRSRRPTRSCRRFWRLRETQALVVWLRERQPATVTVATIARHGSRQRLAGDWWSVLTRVLRGIAARSSATGLSRSRTCLNGWPNGGAICDAGRPDFCF